MDCRQQTTSPVLTKHDVVDRVSVHVLLVDVGGEQLNVAAAAVDALLVLHGELDDEGLVLVVEVTEAGRHGVEAGVLACLQTCKKNQEEIIKSSSEATWKILFLPCLRKRWRVEGENDAESRVVELLLHCAYW